MGDVKLGAVGQVSRKTRDVASATRWYREVLGLRHLYSFGKLAFFDLDGVRLFLSEGSGDGDSILYFRVSGIHDAVKALAGRGAVFTEQPHMIHRHADGTEEWMAFFRDPDGKNLALMEQIKPAP